MNQNRISYLNGQFIPLKDAHVSVMDRGFLLGDGVYEVIPVYHGKLFRFDQHLVRLKHSLSALKIELGFPPEDFLSIAKAIIQQNETFESASIYLQITRGSAWIRDHAFPQQIKPTVFVTYFPILGTASDAPKNPGISCITLHDTRWENCDIKAITLLPNVLAKAEAQEKGVQDAIFIREGLALEGTSSNLFIVRDNTLMTPPKDHSILGGITRDLVVELAKIHQLPVQEHNILKDWLAAAEEIWLTSSTKEILPVVSLNGKTIGSGKPGPVWMKMNDWYQAFKKSLK